MITKAKPINTLSERLKARRLELGMTQKDVAKLAGVTQGAIGNLETDDRKNPRELLAIARAVKLRPEWLKTGQGPKEFYAEMWTAAQKGAAPEAFACPQKTVGWPFASITSAQWQRLPPDVKQKAEALLLALLAG